MADSRLIQWLQIARGIEAGGHYHLSKLVWAMIYAEEIRLSSAAGIPHGEELFQALERMIAGLREEGAPAEQIAALEHGLNGLRTDDAVNLPPVFVSRIDGALYLGERPESTTGDDPLDLREFRPVYYLDPLPVSQMLEALRRFPVEVASILEGVTNEQMSLTPIPGEWSLKELLTHFHATEGLLAYRARLILEQDNPTIGGAAGWQMTTTALSAREVFEAYTASRAETIALLTPLKPERWWRPAHHSEWGSLTLQEHVSYFTRHERSHTRQLRQIVSALG